MFTHTGKVFFVCCLLIVVASFPTRVVAAPRTTALHIDHTDALNFMQIESLSPTALQPTINQRLRIEHASIGWSIGQPTYSVMYNNTTMYSGLEELKRQNQKFDYSNWLFVSRGNPPWQAKADYFVNNIQTNQANFDIFTFKYCYIDFAADPNYYITKMEEAERLYPTKQFIWWTMPIKSLDEYTANTYPYTLTEQSQRLAFNQTVRQYALSHNKVLFDMADLESWNYQTNTPTTYTHRATGTTYPILNPTFTSDKGHLNRGDGRIWVAKAWWMMMHQLANEHSPSQSPTPRASNTPLPGTPTPRPTVPGDANGDGRVTLADLAIWVNNYLQPNRTVSGGNFNSDTKVDGLDYVIWRLNEQN